MNIDWKKFIGFIIGAVVSLLIGVIMIEDDELWMIIFGSIAVLLICGAFAFIAEAIAKEKGYEYAHVWALTFWFGILGWLVVIALPDKQARPVYVENAELNVNILASGNRDSDAVETYIPDTETAFDWLN